MKLESKFNKFAQEGGFTLIEMLIVVAIIGILVAIAVPALNTAKSDAQASKKASALSAIALAKNRYVLKDTTTDANVTAFNAATDAAKISTLSPYMLVNGVAVTSSATLLAGTGGTAVTIGNIDVQGTPADEGTVATITP